MLSLTTKSKKIIIGVIVLLLSTVAVYAYSRRKRTIKIIFNIFIQSSIIQTNKMQTIKKSQFKNAIIGQLQAENEAGEAKQFLIGSVKVESDNPEVITVTQDEADETKISLAYAGPGKATIKASAQILADVPTTAEGTLELTVEDDSDAEAPLDITGEEGEGKNDNPPAPEAVKINLSLNL
jgi:hypothetical protein